MNFPLYYLVFVPCARRDCFYSTFGPTRLCGAVGSSYSEPIDKYPESLWLASPIETFTEVIA